MTLYKHLVYVDFVRFIRQPDSPPYYMEMLVFKHIQNRFYFSKIKDFMFQILSICRYLLLNMLFHKKIQTGVCVSGGEGGGLRTYVFEKKNPRESKESKTLALDIPQSCVAPLANSKAKNQD